MTGPDLYCLDNARLVFEEIGGNDEDAQSPVRLRDARTPRRTHEIYFQVKN
jgi:hypothetical protein